MNFRNLWFSTNFLEEGRESKRYTPSPSPQQRTEKEGDEEEEWLRRQKA